METLRAGNRSFAKGVVRDAIEIPLRTLRKVHGKVKDQEMSATRIAAALTVVSNSSVLFTTRDWSVAGTLSTMAGALAAAAASDK